MARSIFPERIGFSQTDKDNNFGSIREEGVTGSAITFVALF
ncbi:hypothetical protein [Autumnicola musiva]|uniref:Uncharacterized protein n=1 Tax=Autumnicola musiva TaxID=3075589 RepID=A0ABU3D6P2_9FLAO|nr:hypothetical protein [Zunongwangia sp. F117]MDT0677197.1 hypothetical protein [Zunongwangia sp. F117]